MWIKIEDGGLDWPTVQFVIKERDALSLPQRIGVTLISNNPKQVEESFCAMVGRLFPEYQGVALLAFGYDPYRRWFYYNALHQRFPNTKPDVMPPRWWLNHRCSRLDCNKPIDADRNNMYHLENAPESSPYAYIERILCYHCYEAGHRPPDVVPLTEPKRNADVKTVDIYPVAYWSDDPIIHEEKRKDQ